MVDAIKVPGYHSHECLSCGTKWIHGDENAGNQAEHTCPTCGKTMPLTLGSVQLPDGTLSWRYGWAKAGVIMANGQEQKVPVQVQPITAYSKHRQIIDILEIVFWVTVITGAGFMLYRTITKTGGITIPE